ncbi:hypothetical protein E4U46_007387 [Claviceps purpurea]|nr:hypothetical protein E4U46_007387 [Claviceps purpurea]
MAKALHPYALERSSRPPSNLSSATLKTEPPHANYCRFKADRIELMYEAEASGDPDEFVVPKGEGDGLDCTGHDEGVDLNLGRDGDPDDYSRVD